MAQHGASPGGGGGRLGGPVVVLMKAGHDAQVGAALGAVVLRLAAQDAAAVVDGVPAEVAAERRAVAHGWGVRDARRVGAAAGPGLRLPAAAAAAAAATAASRQTLARALRLLHAHLEAGYRSGPVTEISWHLR